MPSDQIQWFPGHMAKTRRLISENLKNVDVVIELLDARIPMSSRNPEITKLTAGKPSLIILNKASLADPEQNKYWQKLYTTESSACITVDCLTGEGLNKILPAIKELMKEKLERYESRGMMGRRIFAMVLGIPNVGKSTLINKLSGSKKAKVENRPGVTLSNQWVPTSVGLDLLDTPGILWPKFEDERVGFKLAATGAIKDHILDTEEIAMLLCSELLKISEKEFTERYKLDPEEARELDSYDLFRLVGKKRGFLISGGDIDHKRTAEMLLEEFRSAKIGRISLELP